MFRRVSGTYPKKHSVNGYNHTMKQNFECVCGVGGGSVYKLCSGLFPAPLIQEESFDFTNEMRY